MKRFLLTTTAAALTLLPFAGSAAAEPTMTKSPSADAVRKADNIIASMRTEAVELARHAAGLESWSQFSTMSWQSHASALQEVRGRLKMMDQYRQKLAALEGRILPEQTAVLARATPALRGIAANVGRAVVESHELQRNSALLEPEYMKAVAGFYDHTVELRQALKADATSNTVDAD